MQTFNETAMPFKSYLIAALALLMLTFTACSKKKKAPGEDPGPQEEVLKATLDGVAEGNYTASPGATYSFTVNISSKLPTKGVSITVDAVTDPGGEVIPQDAIPSPVTAATTTINLKGLEPIRTVKVTITITSLDNPNNIVKKEFWITNKTD
ncbi:hypothetical protein [Chitinophaga sp. GbtcB8]|uniref:hypothetical protein n=1 Tax=Chitinophaga sp. GbtcB8 TaxID=2824753 RepID=UPI001C2FE224|nr:hypothetical protein [Chitinophaga sp. GbtcB8]